MGVILKRLFVYFITICIPAQSFGFRAPDMSGDDSGAAVVYDFQENVGDTAFDTSGFGTAIDVRMSVQGNLPTGDGTIIRTNAVLLNGSLTVNPKPNAGNQGYESAQRHRTFLVSDTAATKLNSCNSGFTIQVFLRPWFPFQGSDSGNLIVGLTNSEGRTSVASPNFGLYQTGQAGAESASLVVRTGNSNASTVTSVPAAYSSVTEMDNPGRFTEIIATQEPSGILTVYVNRIPRSSTSIVNPNFTSTAKLIIGNELVPLTTDQNGEADVDQQRNWSGEIAHLAIYCRGFSKTEILGETMANLSRTEVVVPAIDVDVDLAKIEARRLVERLTGIIIPIDHPMVERVRQRLLQGDRMGAAKIVTGDIDTNEPGHPEFLNTMVKQMAMKMSNREETIRAPFNDFAAAFIGVTRDERNAQELLTADFFYMANPAKANVRSDIFRDILVSNNHYEDLESARWDIGKVLMRVPSSEVPSGYPNGQQIAIGENGARSPNPDPAGVLTSRAFMMAHAIAGTNRRVVEYSFREFMCVEMVNMADTSASPARIGRDVDRLPGGDQTKFETSCKGCHSVMDGFRGAFAKFDFADVTLNDTNYKFVRNVLVNARDDFGFPDNSVDANGTVRKMNHNETVFPNGYIILDDSFVNNAVGTVNRNTFGWEGSNRFGGVGANQFGRMLSESQRFSSCMAKRAFEAVCTPQVRTEFRMSPLMIELGTRFKNNGYKFRKLFQEVASHPECVRNMGR